MASMYSPELNRTYRLCLWILLVLLTTLIVLFPVHLSYEYHAIESIYVFGGGLPLFTVLFYSWVAILIILLFSRDKVGEWQRAGLLCIFTAGVISWWLANTPYGGNPDETWQMGHINYLVETGKLDLSHPVFNYFQFPGFHLALSSLSQVTGLDALHVRTIFILFSGIAFTLLLYLLFIKSLRDSRLASLGVMLMLFGGVIVYRAEMSFWPGNLANLFLVALLLLLHWHEDRKLGVALPLITIITLAAFTISYLPTPTVFIFIILVVYLVQRVGKKNLVAVITIILFLIMFVVWEFYYAASTFQSMVTALPQAFTSGFTEFGSRLFANLQMGAAYTGETVPLWATLNRYIWLALIFGLGGIIGITNLFRVKKLSPAEMIETGGLWGVVIASVATFLAFATAEQIGRFFMYAPFFTIPLVLRFLSRFSQQGESVITSRLTGSLNVVWDWLRKSTLPLLIIFLFVLSLPAFLANNYRVLTQPIYPQENAAGQFLQSAYNTEELNLYSIPFVTIVYSYYVPGASFRTAPTFDVSAGEEGFWREMSQYLGDYQNSRYRSAVFVISERLRHAYGPRILIDSSDPKWLEFLNKLGDSTDKFYENGFVELYYLVR